MTISLFDLLKIGLDDSSPITADAMKSASMFCEALNEQRTLKQVARIRCSLLGEFGSTDNGYSTGVAIIMGLEGHNPATFDASSVSERIEEILESKTISLLGKHDVFFNSRKDIIYHSINESDPEYLDGVRIIAWNADGVELSNCTYVSSDKGLLLTT